MLEHNLYKYLMLLEYLFNCIIFQLC